MSKLLTRTRGQIAVLKVQLKATELGWLVNVPLNNEIYYDLVLDNFKSKELKRVQIKYCNRRTSRNKNNLELNLTSRCSKRIFYKKTDIDWILVFIPEKDVVLKYEQEHFHRKKTLTINLVDKDSVYHYGRYVWK